jgi:hypothetical protein
MKTLVTRTWNTRTGLYEFNIFKWARWDAPDLLEAYPDAWDWRYVSTRGDEESALAIAERLAAGEGKAAKAAVDVVATFGDPDLGAPEASECPTPCVW